MKQTKTLDLGNLRLTITEQTGEEKTLDVLGLDSTGSIEHLMTLSLEATTELVHWLDKEMLGFSVNLTKVAKELPIENQDSIHAEELAQRKATKQASGMPAGVTVFDMSANITNPKSIKIPRG